MPSKDLMIEIKADTKQALTEIEELKKEIKEFSVNVKKGNIDLKRQDEYLNNVTKRLVQMAHAFSAFEVVKSVVSTFADFEQKMANLKAISGATGVEFKNLEEKARELGETTVFSASDVSDGMKYLAMAGYKTKDIMASIGDVLNLAQVGMIDLAKASDIASNILSGFGMKASETKRVVDVMTATITNANTDIPELGEAMKYAAASASGFGVSLEETAAAIAVLSNNGLKGTLAGTGLAQVLTRIATPAGKAKDSLKRLGIKVYDAEGKFIGLKNVLIQFHDKLKTLSQQARNQYIQDIFGQEAAKSAVFLINNVKGAYTDLFNKIQHSSGLADKKVKIMQETLEAKWKELQSALSELAITIGKDLAPALKEIVETLTEIVTATKEFYQENKPLIKTIAELTLVLGGLKTVMGVVRTLLGVKAVKDIAIMLRGVKNLTSAVEMLKIALSAINPLFALLSTAIAGVVYELNRYEEEINRLDESTKKLNNSHQEFKTLLDEVQNHMNFSNGRREIKATADELQKLKDKTKELMLANNKRIQEMTELYKKGTSDNKALEREIDVLIERNKVLGTLYKKLEHTKPYEKAKTSAVEAKKAVEKLTDEQKKYLSNLDKKLEKEKHTTKSILELKNEELKKVEQILGKTKPYEEAKAKIIEYYNLQEINNFKKTYEKRVSLHSSTIEKLKSKEKELADKIIQIQKELQEKLKSIENNRVLAVESIEKKIHNIQMSGASEYKKYVDSKKQADVAYAKAKKALEEGNFTLAKHYMSEYESLVSSVANKEIKENGKVVLSKKRANAEAIKGLKKLEGLTNEYYTKQKTEAKAAYNQKMQQLKAELTATKAQLQLELQRLNLEKELIKAVTGKKVDIDTSGALKAIKNLDKEIKNLDEKIKKPKKIDADTSEANKKVDNVSKKVDNTKGKIKVDADTKPALAGILEIEDKVTGEKEVIKYYADNNEPKQKLNEINGKAKSLKPTIKVKSDVSSAINSLNKIPKTITTIHYIKTVETKATGGVIGTGGGVKLATGGVADFKRINGKIPGYDPNDSDDVPAMLTRGEFVVKRDAVQHYGENLLWALNSKKLPKYATGGLIQKGDVERKKFDYGKNNVNTTQTNEIDLSRFDDLINKLDEIKNIFYKGEDTARAGDVRRLIEELKREKKLITNTNDSLNKENAKYNTMVNENRGKVLTETQFKSYENKLKKEEEIVEIKSKKLDEIQKKAENVINKIEKKEYFFEDFIQKVDNTKEDIKSKMSEFNIPDKLLPEKFDSIYNLGIINKFKDKLESVYIPAQNYKQKIRDKINSLGINESDILPSDFDNNFDLRKIKNFFNSLNSLRPLNESSVNSKFNKYIKDKLGSARSFYYGAGSIYSGEAMSHLMSKYKPNADEFLRSIGIKNTSGLKSKIPVNFDYRTFGGSYSLQPDVLEAISKEYLKEHLPKFQNGGLLQLQAGGKLQGYGGGDRNLALLEDGEFVIRKEAVAHFGTDNFFKLNNLQLPKFQNGGLFNASAVSGGGARDIVDVNLNLGNKSYKMNADIDVAKQLTQELKRMM